MMTQSLTWNAFLEVCKCVCVCVLGESFLSLHWQVFENKLKLALV